MCTSSECAGGVQPLARGGVGLGTPAIGRGVGLLGPALVTLASLALPCGDARTRSHALLHPRARAGTRVTRWRRPLETSLWCCTSVIFSARRRRRLGAGQGFYTNFNAPALSTNKLSREGEGCYRCATSPAVAVAMGAAAAARSVVVAAAAAVVAAGAAASPAASGAAALVAAAAAAVAACGSARCCPLRASCGA